MGLPALTKLLLICTSTFSITKGARGYHYRRLLAPPCSESTTTLYLNSPTTFIITNNIRYTSYITDAITIIIISVPAVACYASYSNFYEAASSSKTSSSNLGATTSSIVTSSAMGSSTESLAAGSSSTFQTSSSTLQSAAASSQFPRRVAHRLRCQVLRLRPPEFIRQANLL
jgi:hypothetical protein